MRDHSCGQGFQVVSNLAFGDAELGADCPLRLARRSGYRLGTVRNFRTFEPAPAQKRKSNCRIMYIMQLNGARGTLSELRSLDSLIAVSRARDFEYYRPPFSDRPLGASP